MPRRSKLYAGLTAALVPAAAVLLALGATPADAAVGGFGALPRRLRDLDQPAQPHHLPTRRPSRPSACPSSSGATAAARPTACPSRTSCARSPPTASWPSPTAARTAPAATNSSMLTAVHRLGRRGELPRRAASTTTGSTPARSPSPASRAAGWRRTPSPTTRASPPPASSAAACSTTPTTTSSGGSTKPIAYFIGGPSDIAYPNAIDDWGKLPAGLPAFMGNLNVGHGGTYDQPNGGEFGRVAVLYLKWRLKGDTTAGTQLRRRQLRAVPHASGPSSRRT